MSFVCRFVLVLATTDLPLILQLSKLIMSRVVVVWNEEVEHDYRVRL